MRSPVAALLWERWCRTRWALAIAAGSMVAVAFLAVMSDGIMDMDGEEAFYFILLGANLLLFVTLLLGHCERDDVSFAFPSRMLRLPLPTRKLTAITLAYDMAILVSLWVLAGALHLWMDTQSSGWSDIDLAREVRFFGLQCLAAATLYAVTQATGHLVGRRPAWAGTAATAGVFCCALFIIGPIMERGMFGRSIIGGKARPLLAFTLLFSILATSSTTSWFAVSRSRRGGLLFPWPTRRHHKASTGKRSKKKPFASPEAAQRWLEFRVAGYQLPIMALVALAAMALIMATYMLSGGSGTRALTRLLGGYHEGSRNLLKGGAAFLLAAAWGAGLLVFALRQRVGSSSFTLTRPLNTRRLAEARLRAGLRSVAMGVGLIIPALLLGLAIKLYEDHTNFYNWSPEFARFMNEWVVNFPSLSRVLGVLGLVCGLATVSWVAWWMRPRAIAVLSVLGVVAALYVVAVVLLLQHSSKGLSHHAIDLLGIALVGIPLPALGVAWTAMRFRRAFRAALISRGTAIAAACVCPLIAWACFQFLSALALTELDGEWFWACLLAAGALLPVALVPEAIHRRRHQ